MPLASMIRDASSKPPPSLSKSTEPISKAVNAGSAAFGATPAAKGYSNVRSVKYCWTGAVRRYARRSSPASTFSDEPRIVAAVITNKDPISLSLNCNSTPYVYLGSQPLLDNCSNG